MDLQSGVDSPQNAHGELSIRPRRSDSLSAEPRKMTSAKGRPQPFRSRLAGPESIQARRTPQLEAKIRHAIRRSDRWGEMDRGLERFRQLLQEKSSTISSLALEELEGRASCSPLPRQAEATATIGGGSRAKGDGKGTKARRWRC
jgi:hypothetical protein